MNQLVCQFCKNEIKNKMQIIDPKGELAKKSVCIVCFMEYIEKYQHLKGWYDEKTDPRDSEF